MVWTKVVDNISAKLAFFPPTPSTYKVFEHPERPGEYRLVVQGETLSFPGLQIFLVNPSAYKDNERPACSGGGRCIGDDGALVAAYFKYRSSSGSPAQFTLLYSHGNAVDLGQMVFIYRDLSRLLRCDVYGYDYSGYGCSSGVPTVTNTIADVTAAFHHLTKGLGVPPHRVVLYGQSVGTGPSTSLAARRRDIAGVVLHSPLLSGVRVLRPHLKFWPAWADVYPNHVLAPKIKRPVLVLHGTEDEVIHVSCGQRLWDLLPEASRVPPLWAQGYGHQDLEQCPAYLSTLQGFLTTLTRDPHCGVPPPASQVRPHSASTSSRRANGNTNQPHQHHHRHGGHSARSSSLSNAAGSNSSAAAASSTSAGTPAVVMAKRKSSVDTAVPAADGDKTQPLYDDNPAAADGGGTGLGDGPGGGGPGGGGAARAAPSTAVRVESAGRGYRAAGEGGIWSNSIRAADGALTGTAASTAAGTVSTPSRANGRVLANSVDDEKSSTAMRTMRTTGANAAGTAIGGSVAGEWKGGGVRSGEVCYGGAPPSLLMPGMGMGMADEVSGGVVSNAPVAMVSAAARGKSTV